jgi:hypothetical protein
MAGSRGAVDPREGWWGLGPPRDYRSCAGCGEPMREGAPVRFHETSFPVLILCCRCYVAWERRWHELERRGFGLPTCCATYAKGQGGDDGV